MYWLLKYNIFWLCLIFISRCLLLVIDFLCYSVLCPYVLLLFRAGQRVNVDPKGFSKGFLTGKIQTKRFSKGCFTGEIQTKRFSKGCFTGEIQTKRFSKGFFTGEILTKRFSKDSRRGEDPVQTPPLPPSGCLWHLPLTWNLKYFCLFDIIMQLSSCKDKITAIITVW